MLTRRTLLSAVSAAVLLGGAAASAQSLPAGYPGDYGDLVAKAKKEGSVSIYTSTDQAQGQALVDAFKAAYGIAVEYNDLGTNGTYSRVISEAAAKQVGADVVWTSAMDHGMLLVEKGLAEPYRTVEAGSLPAWTNYKDTLYGTSVEPASILYNKTLLPAALVPKSRADLIRVLKENRDTLKGKVASFDPEKSGTGFMFATNDIRNTGNFWELVTAFGALDGKVYASSGAMKEKVVSGEQILAFNVIGSYAMNWVEENPNLGVVFQGDYTAAFSRVALVTKGAPHPSAGRLLLDFMLSQKGQDVLAGKGVPSIRADVPTGLNINTLNARVGGNLKPIAVDDKLSEYADPKKRAEFFQTWRRSMRGS